VPGVQTTVSLADAARQITAGSFEGNPKWLTLNRNQDVLNYAAQQASVNNPDLFNTECSVMPVIAYLADHKAETLARVVEPPLRVRADARRQGPDVPACRRQRRDRGGDQHRRRAGEPHDAALRLRGRDRAVPGHLPQLARVVVAVVPLVLTSILCEALMVVLGIGVKVATLPVIALGVGIGVDYALYLLSVQLAQQRAGYR
jgi:hypothetical protein